MIKSCPICQSKREVCFNATILRKYKVDFLYCETCGFLQSETPYWLKEAYNNPISDADTGILSRNIAISRKLACLLFFLFDKEGRYIDIAGGYGILTRLMRDAGFNFYWSDLYCKNIFAKGFEAVDDLRPFSAVTVFEVLEHIHDPLVFIEKALYEAGTSTIIFSTELFEGKPPKPDNWWYYSLDAGQHISFYQSRTLQKIADRLSLQFYSNNNIHIITDKRLNKTCFRLMTSRFSHLVSYYLKYKMNSKTFNDHKMILNR